MEVTKVKMQEMLDWYNKALLEVHELEAAEAFGKVAASVDNAIKIMADNAEKQAWVNYVLCDQSYRLGFYLWRHNETLDKELMDEVKTFTLPEEAIKYARSFEEDDNKIKERIMGEVKEVDKRRAGIDILKGVLSGDDLETAKKKQADFEERMNKAMGVQTEKPTEG